MSLSNESILFFDLGIPLSNGPPPFNDLGIPPSNGPPSGFSDLTDVPNSLDTHNMIQNNESGISPRLTSDDDKINDNLPPIESVKVRKEEKNEEKSENQTTNKETIRKRQYRSTERVLFNKLRDLFPSDTMKTKHQLLRDAIRAIQELRELKSGQKL